MRLFEFLMVLVSIIIGLGITEILTGVAQTIRRRESVRYFWVHSILVVAVFLAQLQQWWESWGLRIVPEWTFVGLLMMLGGPICLYLIAHLLFPEPGETTNYREYYFGPMRPVWWLAAIAVVISTTWRPLIFGTTLISTANATSIVLFAGFITLAFVKRETPHAIIVPLFLLLLLIDIFQWSFTLGQG